MTTTPARFASAYHEPGRNKPCVCGSGLKFKKCCMGSYSSKALVLFRNAYNSGDFEDALVHARNHFTWYALAHKAHTIHLLEANQDNSEKLLRIDIEALAELLENLHLCYYQLGRSDEFRDVVESVRNVVLDRRWDAKIGYIRGLWYLVDRHDEGAAFAAIRTIDFQTCQDSDILSLYLHVCPTSLTLTESVDIIDRIVANTEKESVRLQYRVLKAIKYYLICQQADGDRIIEEAITKFDNLSEEKKSHYGKFQFANALEIYGKAANRHDIFERGRRAIRDLIHEAKNEKYITSYVADLNNLLGDFEESLGNHNDAIHAYSISLERNPSELTKVFLARSVCNNGNFNEARKLLKSIDDSFLDEPGRFDLSISWALLAASSLDVGDIGEAKHRLKAIETHDPVFIQLRDQWMIDLLEAKPKTETGKIRGLIRSLNKYLILNPNIFGLGININKIIDDAESATKNKL